MADIPFAQELLQWKLTDFSGNLRSTNKYIGGKGANLFCKKNSKFLTFTDETGVNVGFSANGGKKVHFKLPADATREILTGDVVAFGLGGDPSFLVYESRPVGINLAYHSRPAYEWIIMDSSGKGGRPIGPNTDLALANRNVDVGGKKVIDFLVFKERLGGDIAWTTSPDWKGTIWGKAKDVGLALAEKAIVAAIGV